MATERIIGVQSEENYIQQLLTSLHTLNQLADLHRKKLEELNNNNNITPDIVRAELKKEAAIATTISRLTDKILRLYRSFLNRYHA